MAKTLVFSDPSIDGAKFQFGLGITGTAAYYPTLPNVLGAASSWHIAEWHATETLDPQMMGLTGPDNDNVLLGIPNYRWATANGDLDLSVYGLQGGLGYSLFDYGGQLTSAGGQNLLLETSTLAGGVATFDHPITFDADEAITSVKAGGIAQQAGNNFTVTFNSPGTPSYDPHSPSFGVFLQVVLTDSRGTPGAYFDFSGATPIYNVTGVRSLDFTPATHSSHVSIDLNAALKQFIAAYQQFGPATHIAGLANLANWSLSSVYIGDESSAGGGLSLNVANIKVTTDSALAYSDANAPIVTITANPNLNPETGLISYTDTISGISATATSTAYTGPVDYLRHQYIWAGSDAVNLAANASNVFLKGGPGTDALSVSGGDNVLDGGTGSNFLVGAVGHDGGRDDFFVDGRAGSTTWSTIVNFHPRDMATLWGFDPAKNKLTWTDGLGARGYAGATLEATTSDPNANMLMTFSGLSKAELLAHATMTTGALDGTNYLLIVYDH